MLGPRLFSSRVKTVSAYPAYLQPTFRWLINLLLRPKTPTGVYGGILLGFFLFSYLFNTHIRLVRAVDRVVILLLPGSRNSRLQCNSNVNLFITTDSGCCDMSGRIYQENISIMFHFFFSIYYLVYRRKLSKNLSKKCIHLNKLTSHSGTR